MHETLIFKHYIYDSPSYLFLSDSLSLPSIALYASVTPTAPVPKVPLTLYVARMVSSTFLLAMQAAQTLPKTPTTLTGLRYVPPLST